uniref:Uncharacterized protein n=1 Tax=Bos indicus x Bos taurus TaxID=30522 RepID=A0A4W2G1P3_BOBOX
IAGQPGPHPHLPNIEHPEGCNPAHPPSANTTFPLGPPSHSPRSTPGESSSSPWWALLSCATTRVFRMPALRSLPLPIPTTCPWHVSCEPIGSWHGSTRNGDRQRMQKKMKNDHKKQQKHHKHGRRHTSSRSSTPSHDSD